MFILQGFHTIRNYSAISLKHVRYGFNYFNRYFATGPKLILYGDEASPPVRFVLMTASVLDIKLDFHKIDLFLGENNTEFYKKINPLLKVPALTVNNNVICDSHAITLFLCRLNKNTDLYPKDIKKRALVDVMLFFNASLLFPIDSEIFSEFFAGKWPADDAKIEKWNRLLDFLEYNLDQNEWLAGNKLTLSDLCCGTTVSSLQLLVPPSKRHAKVNKWMNKLRSVNIFQINGKGLERLKSFVDKMGCNI